ncbi:MAG: hypothetical protein QW175_05715 [Candidatus Bathyarchaeia archaeon]
MAKFVETFETLDPEKWVVWRGAGTLNICEVAKGKVRFLTGYQGLNGYVVLCSNKPYLLANNGVEIDFEMVEGSCGHIMLLIAPYRIRAGIPFYLLKNFDAVVFEIDAWYRHWAIAYSNRRGFRTAVRKQCPDNVFSGKLRLQNKNGITAFYFNDVKISESAQLANMNVATFIQVLAYTDMYFVPRTVEAYVDTFSIDDIGIAGLGLQWVEMLNTMMVITMLLAFSSIIKKIRRLRE